MIISQKRPCNVNSRNTYERRFTGHWLGFGHTRFPRTNDQEILGQETKYISLELVSSPSQENDPILRTNQTLSVTL